MLDQSRRPLADDTSPAAEQALIRRWREMSGAEKARLASLLCRRTNALAAAGIKLRHPDDSLRQRFLRLAIVRLGYALAVRAFPDAAGLEP